MNKIGIEECSKDWGKPRWMLNSIEQFSIRSAWDNVRKFKEVNYEYNHIWAKGVPFIVFIFLWRL